jgi:signal transduction histidine kinase/ligand-binding sensor domain-containing protein
LALLGGVALCAEQLPVRTYGTTDGLAGNLVTCIVKDPRGFLWFCASGLISRFDGYTFANYGMKVGNVNAYLTDFRISRQGVYWAATTDGLFRLDPNSPPPQKFEAVPIGVTENSRRVTTLAEDRSGALWAGTWDGLYRLAVGKSEFQPVDIGIPNGVDGRRNVDFLLEDRQDMLWAIAGDRLYRRTPDGKTTVYSDPWFKRGQLALYADRHGRLWVCTNAGLGVLNPDAGSTDRSLTRRYTTKDGLPHERVEALTETSDGWLWAGGAVGLSRYTPEMDRFESYTAAHGLSDPNVKSLAEDREGNLWAGTENGGVMKIARRGFTSYTQADGLSKLRIASVFLDLAGELCAVTSPTGDKWSLECFNGKRFKSIRPKYPSKIRYFGWGWNQVAFQDHTGEWWIPTGEGLCRFAKANRAAELAGRRPKAVYTTRDGLPSNNIFRLFEDSQGNVWISVVGQPINPLTRWERTTGRFQVFGEADGLPRNQWSAEAFAEDRFGQTWIGHGGGRLARFRDGRFTMYYGADGVPVGRITALHLDHAGRLWIASTLGGLGRIDNLREAKPNFVKYTMAEGLSSNSVFCVTEDQWGRIYLGTALGVDRLDPATGHVKHYTTADGLARGVISVARRDRDGDLWFGSPLGLSRLIPEPDRPVPPPPVFITGIQARGIPQTLCELGETSVPQLPLRPNQNQVQLSFVGLGFATGELLRYQYRLEGADRDWSPPTEQRTVNYASLKPGAYRFEVRALNTEGAVSPISASVPFTVQAPFWQRWWFLTVSGIVLSTLIYALYRYRSAQLVAIERVRVRIAADLHDDIGASLSQIAVLSEVAHRKIQGANLETAEPLFEIASISRELVDAMGDIVWAINPKHDRLSNLEHRMRRFASDVLCARNIDLDFRASAGLGDIRVGADLRRQVFLIFKEAVNNIARHSGCTQARVDFKAVEDGLFVEIADSGKGFDPTACIEGNGLMNIRKRVSDLGGSLMLESAHNHGTSVRLRLPLPHQYWWGRGTRTQGKL